MRVKKKHQAGAAKNFITRTQAVRKLQISLADFRRLCIFKGIYPREPRNKKKANKGSTAPVTFYYAKDIQYLLHEPVLNKFREHKIFAKKLTKALGKGELGTAKRLDENRPVYKLDGIVKQRYPTFIDALRDLDDPLAMLFLFEGLPASNLVNPKIVKDAERLCHEWMAYVAREKLLRKVFVSIKGVYYEAVVKGEKIRWLVPFKFPQNVPTDVDFRIMVTFLEFYTTLLQFVLYRLYNEAELTYPPKINREKINGLGGISAYILESSQSEGVQSLLPSIQKESDKNLEVQEISVSEMAKIVESDRNTIDATVVADGNDESVEDDVLDAFETNQPQSDILPQPLALSKADALTLLFGNFTFLLSREVPLHILELPILSFSGRIYHESDLPPIDSEAYQQIIDSVTHIIIDRPAVSQKLPGKVYVQPQWVLDSVNEGKLVSTRGYGIGERCPAHLSPWGDADGYDPTADADISPEAEEVDIESVDEADADADADEEDEEDDSILQDSSAEKESKEEIELRKMMMTNKQRKLYTKMQYGIAKKSERIEKLKKKKSELKKKK